MDENSPLILDATDSTPQPEAKAPEQRFLVLPHLLVLVVILIGLFSSVLVPRTVALLSSSSVPNTVPNTINLSDRIEQKAIPKLDAIDLRAEAAFVWDVAGQRSLLQKNADQVKPLASLTKLMTALVAYELVPNETTVTISSIAANQQSGGTLRSGERFSIKPLADFALVSSFNSAAYALADSVGAKLGDGQAVSNFVTAMNIQAERLNLPTLRFLNPTGLDVSTDEAGAYGSARDVTFLLEYILRNHPDILLPTITPRMRLYNQVGEYHEANNTNELLGVVPNLLGSKTGYTDLSGGNLTLVFDVGFNRPVIITVLGSTRSERFADVAALVRAVQAAALINE